MEYYQTLASLENFVLVSTKKKKVEVCRKSDGGDWLHRIYNEGSPIMKIGECEIDLREIYSNVDFEEAYRQVAEQNKSAASVGMPRFFNNS